MKLIVVISILTLIRAEDNLGEYEYVIHGVRHHREILFENLPSDFNLRGNYLPTDYSTNDLFVAFYDPFELAVLNINNREIKYITCITSRAQCITVDQVNHNVYIGTDNGIYKYNGTDKAELVGAAGVDVWRIYYSNGVLYYTDYDTHTLRTLVNGQTEHFNRNMTVSNFVVDNEENIVFISSHRSLYKHKTSTKENIKYRGISDVKYIATNRDGNVYFLVHDGVYEIKEDGVVRIAHIDNPTHIAFDNENNIIYYNEAEKKLYRLKPIGKSVNETNTCSDLHNHVQVPEDSNITDIITEIQTLNTDIKTELQTLRTMNNDIKTVLQSLQTMNNDIKTVLPTKNNDIKTEHHAMNIDIKTELEAINNKTDNFP